MLFCTQQLFMCVQGHLLTFWFFCLWPTHVSNSLSVCFFVVVLSFKVLCWNCMIPAPVPVLNPRLLSESLNASFWCQYLALAIFVGLPPFRNWNKGHCSAIPVPKRRWSDGEGGDVSSTWWGLLRRPWLPLRASKGCQRQRLWLPLQVCLGHLGK